MAATVTTTMAILNPKCLTPTTTSSPKIPATATAAKPHLPKSLLLQAAAKPTTSSSLSSAAIAGAFFSTLSSCDAAMAAQQIAEIAEGDNRGLALLLPIIPAIAWVLYNILQPALNQINKMRSTKGVVVGLGLGGLCASGFMATAPEASAAGGEIAAVAEAAAGSDSRGQLLLFVVAPALVWVAYNILQPALNQLNKMRSQ